MINNQAVLSDFCQIIQGGRLKLSGNDFVAKGYPAFGAGGLNGYLEVAEFNCQAVILSAIGARCGKCFHADPQWTSLANTQVIIPDPLRADSRFLWHQLNNEKRWPRSGTGQPFIKPSDVKLHKVYLPPLEEQRRIAAILDKADELLGKSSLLIQKVPFIEKSIFKSLLGEFTSSGPIYPVRTLEEIVEDNKIGLVRASNECSKEFPHPYLKMDAIGKDGSLLLHKATKTSASAEELASYSIRDGDVLFNTRNSRELVGKTAVYRGNQEMLFNNNLMRIRFKPKTASPNFFRLFLSSRQGVSEISRRKSGTTSVCAIYWKNLKNLPVPLPPYELQLQLEESLKSVEKLSKKYFEQEKQCINIAKALKSSLMNAASKA